MPAFMSVLPNLKNLLASSCKFNALNGSCTRCAHNYAKTGNQLQRFNIQHQYFAFGIARVDVLATSIKRGHNVQIALRQ